MAADFTSITEVRKHFFASTQEVEAALFKMQEAMADMHQRVNKILADFSKSDHVAHKVGRRLETLGSNVSKLQSLRKSIYENADLVAYIRVEIIFKVQELMNDVKSLFDSQWTEICGSEFTAKFLNTNADKEREANYLMSGCTVKFNKIKSMFSTIKAHTDFLTDNLDQLNKTESALRLSYNMSKSLDDIGDNAGEQIGTDEGTALIQGYDPLVDE